MRKFIFFTVLVLVQASPQLFGQTSDKAYLDLVNQFFELIHDSKYTDAVDKLYSANPWMKTKLDEYETVKRGMAGLPSLVGSITSHEQLSDAFLGSGFVHLDYIVNCERQPLRFYFDFHKVRDKWISISFGYRDDLTDWAIEKSKT